MLSRSIYVYVFTYPFIGRAGALLYLPEHVYYTKFELTSRQLCVTLLSHFVLETELEKKKQQV